MKTVSFGIRYFFFLTIVLICEIAEAQEKSRFPLLIIEDTVTHLSRAVNEARPLENLRIVNAGGKTIQVEDGDGNMYLQTPVKTIVSFIVGGALGEHKIFDIDQKGKRTKIFSFQVNTKTEINDGGYYREMFNLFYKSMDAEKEYSLKWNGKTYRYFEPWVLDHCENMKGLKYFKPYGAEMVDLMRQTQRSDGMIYSFVHNEPNVDYFFTRDKKSGYTQLIGDKVFTRQPTENHPEYLYVNTIYQCWQADGDDKWMEINLASAAKALDYTRNDPSRWSNRFGLLKRVYTIDSWDFAVEDEYMPDLGITSSMMIDSVKSKFGIFFGDNTGYVAACYELAEMFRHAGNNAEATKYKTLGDELKNRLNHLSWNGKYFTHFIEEDSTVIRHLGVDEKTQVAQANAYSLNRAISPEQSKAIIETYMNMKNNLPVGSPGEWYAIYPPFQKGFSKHDAVWQYMNGGVGGHVAGELARGAYGNGYEKYGTDILCRLFELGKKHDGKIYFSYTGSIPPPPLSPFYQPLDISVYANMDSRNVDGKKTSWMNGTRVGDDFRELPVGEQRFNGIRFNVIDPERNNQKAVIAVSQTKGLPAMVEIEVNKKAACIYLLHTSGRPASENVAGSIIFQYADGSTRTNYMIYGKQLSYWMFARLKTDYSGIAWYGKNPVSEGIGLSWCAMDNPEPDKIIDKIVVKAPEGNSIYTLFAVTLSNQKHFVPVNPVSFGGPDNWAAATAMASLIEGLAGIKNMPGTIVFSNPVVSPKWVTTQSDSIHVTVRYAASRGYVAYQFLSEKNKKQIRLLVTGSGKRIQYHILLPDKITGIKNIVCNHSPVPYAVSQIENSYYADFVIVNTGPQEIMINY